MEKPVFETQQVEFSDSSARFEAGVDYVAILVGGEMSDYLSKRNIRDNVELKLMTIPESEFRKNPAITAKKSAWVPRMAAGRALVGAGILTKEQKNEAITSGTAFLVGFEEGKKRENAETGEEYRPKIWHASRIEEEAE